MTAERQAQLSTVLDHVKPVKSLVAEMLVTCKHCLCYGFIGQRCDKCGRIVTT